MKKNFKEMSIKELIDIRYNPQSDIEDVLEAIKELDTKKPEAVLPCRNYQ